MSNQQNNPPKSPYQSNRGTPHNQSNDTSSCVFVNKQSASDIASQSTVNQPAQEAASVQSSPPKNRSVPSTPLQSQGNKQSAVSTPPNSLSRTVRDKTSKSPGNTSTFPNRDKPPLVFSPTVTSTPRSPKTRDRQPQPSSSTPLRISLKLSDNSQAQTTTQAAQRPPCPPCPLDCPPCPRISTTPPVRPTSNQSAACTPPNAASGVEPREAAEQPSTEGPSVASSKKPEGAKKDRIMRLEIMSINGGTFYDVDKIPQQCSPKRALANVEPSYDPRFDVDRIAPQRATSVTECDTETAMEMDTSEDRKRASNEKECRPPFVQGQDDTFAPRSLDEGSSFARDDALSKTESFKTPDSSLAAPAAPRKPKRMGSDEECDIVRSAPGEVLSHDIASQYRYSQDPLPYEQNWEKEAGEEVLPPGSHSIVPSGGNDILQLSTSIVPFGSTVSGIIDESGSKIQGEDHDGTRNLGVDRKMGKGGNERTDVAGPSERGETERQDGAGTSAKTSAVAGGIIPAEQTADEQIVADESRGSISMILGPSVRNFAHIAMSPLISLRTLIGPAPTGRPSRRKRFLRFSDDLSHPDSRMRSIRSAFVVTPYEAAASSLCFFVRRQTKKSRKTLSPKSELSGRDDSEDD